MIVAYTDFLRMVSFEFLSFELVEGSWLCIWKHRIKIETGWGCRSHQVFKISSQLIVGFLQLERRHLLESITQPTALPRT